jgi:hypothetical protein
MSTPDISKESVYDARVLSPPSRYAVNKGGQAITSTIFQAVAQTAQQHTYNVNVPSLQTFIDRAVDWTSTVFLQFTATMGNPQPIAGSSEPIVVIGRDLALSPFPLHQLVGTMTCQLNDTTISLNTDTVFREVLRLTDYKANRMIRTCPTKLDMYQNYDDAFLSINTPIASYVDASDQGQVPNGAYYDVEFTLPAGGALPANSVSAYVSGGINVPTNGDATPIRNNQGSGNADGPYPLFLKFRSKEKLVLSPFIFADSLEYSTALFGVNNMNFVFTINSNGPARVLRSTSGSFRTISNIAFNVQSTAGAFTGSQLSMLFLSPNLDLPLPAKSTVPLTTFPRYISNIQQNIPGATASGNGQAPGIQTNAITMPSTPSMIIIYARPANYGASNICDFYLPITSLSITYNNVAGLMVNHTKEQLYQLSQANGLEMDYDQWCGRGWSARTGGKIPLSGGFVCVVPGKDFALQTGDAGGVSGQSVLQVQCTVENQTNASILAGNAQLVIITVLSGFLETLAGSSRQILNLLTESDVINAPMAPEQTQGQLVHKVGGAFFSNLGSMLSKAIGAYQATKPIVSGIKNILPESGMSGKVKGALGAVGYGATGAGRAGAGSRKKLEERLMM